MLETLVQTRRRSCLGPFFTNNAAMTETYEEQIAEVLGFAREQIGAVRGYQASACSSYTSTSTISTGSPGSAVTIFVIA